MATRKLIRKDSALRFAVSRLGVVTLFGHPPLVEYSLRDTIRLRAKSLAIRHLRQRKNGLINIIRGLSADVEMTQLVDTQSRQKVIHDVDLRRAPID